MVDDLLFYLEMAGPGYPTSNAAKKKAAAAKKKTKSPSTKRRDLTRLTAFRNKKAASPSVPLASEFSPWIFQ